MANRYRGEFELSAGDKTYTLRYGTNELIVLGDKLGELHNRGHVPPEEFQSLPLGLRELRLFIWAGLLEHHGELELKEVGKIIDEVGIEQIESSVNKGLELAFPDAGKAGGKGPKGRAARGTGRRSSKTA